MADVNASLSGYRIPRKADRTMEAGSTSSSSASRLENGNTLVGFGMAEDSEHGATGPIAVFEVTPENRVLWKLEVVEGVKFVYRATPLSTLGGEVEVDGPRTDLATGPVR